jgi:2,5-diketo-D-gluconate reductase B
MKALTVADTTVPALGLGTWQLTGDDCTYADAVALELGYRHVDTARMYGNESEVGTALKASGVPREELFVTSKVPPADLSPEGVRTVVETSLVKLKTDYLDNMLLHWPDPDGTPEACLDALAECRERGLVRHFGVSNYTPRLLERSLAHRPELFNLQVEYHPYLEQEALLRLCRDHDVLLTAYSPLARGRVGDDEVMQQIAQSHDASPTQVALAWLLRQSHVAVIPKASSRDHLLSNWEAQRIELSDDEVARIDRLPKDRRLIDPPFAPDWGPRSARL